MGAPVRVALFVTALALVLGAAWGVGRAVEDGVEEGSHEAAAEDGDAGPEEKHSHGH